MIDIKKVDSRQVPKIIDICSNKKYHDILYSYLQEISDWDEVKGHPRYLSKKAINYSNIATVLGLSRQTVSAKFKNLVGMGLIKEKAGDKDYYELELLPDEVAALIPHKTLKLLVDTLSENAVSSYIYLLRKYLKENCHPYQFTLGEIKRQIGICATTRSNDDIITNILFVLQKIGLIRYHLTTVTENNDIKTIYQLDYITNYIETQC